MERETQKGKEEAGPSELGMTSLVLGRAGAGGGMKFDDVRVLTFDCYGTLIDWEVGILGVLRPWAARTGISADDPQLLGAFSEAEAAAEHDSPQALYPEILRATHGWIAKYFGVAKDADTADLLGRSVGDWPSFDDTREALKRLQRRFKLIVVSNVDRESFARTQKKLGIIFDAVVTAEEVGAYKPDAKMFRRALEVAKQFGAGPGNIVHVAQSLYHDHVPAKSFGLKTVWVQRPSRRGKFGATRDPGVEVKPDVAVHSMEELADVIGE